MSDVKIYVPMHSPAPELSAIITSHGLSNEGLNFTLTCDVHGDESLAPNRTFRWERVESMVLQNGSTLTFDSLSRNDTGEYSCTAMPPSPLHISLELGL